MNSHTESDQWSFQPKILSLAKKWVTSIITPIVLKENDRTIVRIAFLNIDGSI